MPSDDVNMIWVLGTEAVGFICDLFLPCSPEATGFSPIWITDSGPCVLQKLSFVGARWSLEA